MAADPPDDLAPPWPELPFLDALAVELDAAELISTAIDVLERLDEIERHCEAAIGLIRRWKTQGPSGF